MDNKSIYKFAAESGLPAGLYLTLISLGVMLSMKVEFMNLAVLPLIVGFPFFMAWRMNRVVKIRPEYGNFSPLWLFGIYTIIFGTLICMLATYLYLMFVDPYFIKESLDQAIETFSKLPDSGASNMSEIMRQAAEKNVYPSKTQFVTSMGWFTCFGGSMLSLLLAFVISRRRRRRVSMFR
ncbi:MAG: DUF4199 domain-containing protein [Bacteroides sp.]|nr:DUF4199 domain-containing protein [Bacteroides sp.]